MQAEYVQRLRINYSKIGPTRFISHLDLARAWERTLNRAHIPMAYSQGFNRRPRLQMAAPLPLGYTSDCELVDIWLKEEMTPEQVAAQLTPTMPPGIVLNGIAEVALKQAALQTLTREATYRVTLPFAEVDSAEIAHRIDALLARQQVLRQRRGKKYRGKQYNLRPLILDLAPAPPEDDAPVLTMRLQLSEGKAGRPDEVLAAIDLDPLAARVHRTSLTLADDA